jgi:hypothetical protein
VGLLPAFSAGTPMLSFDPEKVLRLLIWNLPMAVWGVLVLSLL